MNVILEGPDNAGKSTLARYVAQSLGRPLVISGGPELYPNEINDRAAAYMLYHNVVFDRHPVISQNIYNQMRAQPQTWVHEENKWRFYDTQPLIIYCRPTTMKGNIPKPHEDPAHLEMVNSKYKDICFLYDKWAMDHAHLWYRVGDSMERTIAAIRGTINGSI